MMLALAVTSASTQAQAEPATINFIFPAAPPGTSLEGRLLVLLSTDDSDEPRNQIDPSVDTQLLFGIDIDEPEERNITLPMSAFRGYPLRTFAEVPAGEYSVQVVLHRYETVHRSDGKTLKLPMDRGVGQKWNRAPGNLYGRPAKLRFDPAKSLKLALDRVMSEIDPPKDTQYVKHVRVQSPLLTAFWGRPMFLSAHVLLPAGFDAHPEPTLAMIQA